MRGSLKKKKKKTHHRLESKVSTECEDSFFFYDVSAD